MKTPFFLVAPIPYQTSTKIELCQTNTFSDSTKGARTQPVMPSILDTERRTRLGVKGFKVVMPTFPNEKKCRTMAPACSTWSKVFHFCRSTNCNQ
jgi:hypothetical protein